MVETFYGVRSYTISDKTKRPSKSKQDLEKIEKRNGNQSRLYISLNNIDEIFSANEKWPVCHDMIFNCIQGKVTKYFNVRSYDRKKEVSYDCINRLYSILKRKLIRLKNEGKRPILFFYLSQFWRYIDLLVYGTVYYDTMDYKYNVQEPEDFRTDEVLTEEQEIQQYHQNEYEEFNDYKKNQDNLDSVDNSEIIKLSIENNTKLLNPERNLLLKLYKKAYQPISSFTLTKKEIQILDELRVKAIEDPQLLKDLKEILDNAQRTEED